MNRKEIVISCYYNRECYLSGVLFLTVNCVAVKGLNFAILATISLRCRFANFCFLRKSIFYVQVVLFLSGFFLAVSCFVFLFEVLLSLPPHQRKERKKDCFCPNVNSPKLSTCIFSDRHKMKSIVLNSSEPGSTMQSSDQLLSNM